MNAMPRRMQAAFDFLLDASVINPLIAPFVTVALASWRDYSSTRTNKDAISKALQLAAGLQDAASKRNDLNQNDKDVINAMVFICDQLAIYVEAAEARKPAAVSTTEKSPKQASK